MSKKFNQEEFNKDMLALTQKYGTIMDGWIEMYNKQKRIANENLIMALDAEIENGRLEAKILDLERNIDALSAEAKELNRIVEELEMENDMLKARGERNEDLK